MRYTELDISGVVVIDIDPIDDERGFFARTVCATEFSSHELPTHYCQSSVSFNHSAGTLRGMHFQVSPSRECKLVRCTRGSVYDVVLDLRKESQTFGVSVGIELSAENRRAIAIPSGCAHGFITLEDCAEVLYMMSEPHAPSLARGIRWNDPRFAISWPRTPQVLSERDASYPDFSPEIIKEG